VAKRDADDGMIIGQVGRVGDERNVEEYAYECGGEEYGWRRGEER
jgi:hypothetical protein